MNTKYQIKGSQIINRASNKPIPDDEPVFILRAKDASAVMALADYIALQPEDEHKRQAYELLKSFKAWRALHTSEVAIPTTDAPGSKVDTVVFEHQMDDGEPILASVPLSTGAVAYRLEQQGWRFFYYHYEPGEYMLMAELPVLAVKPLHFLICDQRPAAITACADRLFRECAVAMEKVNAGP